MCSGPGFREGNVRETPLAELISELKDSGRVKRRGGKDARPKG